MTRHFLRIGDLSLDDARHVFTTARVLKAEPKGRRVDLLRGRSVAVVFEKPSTRTRASFEAGLSQLGAYPVVLEVQGSQIGRGEPIYDTARVLSRYCDAIVFRTSTTQRLVDMARVHVPVINALSDDGHPIQILCDVFTIEEAFAKTGHGIKGRRVAFIGDCSSNMARSWLEAAPIFDFHLVLGGPPEFMPPHDEVEVAKRTGHVTLCHQPSEASVGADVVNTDVWTSMGQEAEAKERLRLLSGWMVTPAMLAKASKDAIVLHCLPAHRGEEIDEAVLEGPQSRVWDQAENRLHVQKALVCFLLGVSHEVA